MGSLYLNIIILVVAVAVLYGLFQHLKKQLRDEHDINQKHFLELAKQELDSMIGQSKTELEMKKQAVDSSIGGLSKELARYETLVNEFEKDRTTKYTRLETELKKASEETSKLHDTTDRLNNILGNVKLRGQWGQRMAEDIIKGCGLIEGVNYKQQKKQDISTTIPDYTFFLPDNHKVNMDVKFSLDNYLHMVNTQDSIQKDIFKKEFLNNVKSRIKELQNRNYINPEENTLDYVLLFIPNEQVYGFIHENSPGLIDDAMKQKVILCSPFTLYAMLTVIRKSFENFHFEKSTKQIATTIDMFVKIYDLFKKRFEELGKLIEKTENQYSDIKEKSFKNLESKIKKIHDYKKGNTVSLGQEEDDIIEIVGEESQDNLLEDRKGSSD